MSSCMVCNFLTSCLPVSNHARGTWAVAWPSNRSARQIRLASAHWSKYSSLLFTIEQFLGGAYALLHGSIYCLQGFSVFVPWVSQSSVWPAHWNAALPWALGALSSFPLTAHSKALSKSHASTCLEAATSCSPLPDCIPEGILLAHKNLLGANKKLSVEYCSSPHEQRTWQYTHEDDPHPLPVCLFFTVPHNSIGLNKSAAMDWNAGRDHLGDWIMVQVLGMSFTSVYIPCISSGQLPLIVCLRL